MMTSAADAEASTPPRPAAAASGGSAPAHIALVLIDGIGDVSVPSLGHCTPLQAAHTPSLDAVAAAGVSGLMDPVEPGLACGSDTAHLSLLGYDPRKHYRGRGAFESLGSGIAMKPGDIAFKSNFATVDDGTGIVERRRVDRHFEEEGLELSRFLDGMAIPGYPQHAVSVKYATEHRCGVVVRGPGLSDRISATDPLKDGRPLGTAAPLDGSAAAQHTAAVVTALSEAMRERLRGHPINAARAAEGKPVANVVLLRGCGIRIEVPSFESRHGLRAAMVAPTKIIAGLGLSLGMDVLHVPKATGDFRTCLASKAEAAAAALCNSLLGGPAPEVKTPGEERAREGREEGYDFAFLHVKAIDDAGHDKNVALKVRALAAADRMVGQLARRLWEAHKQLESQRDTIGRAEQPAAEPRFFLCVTGDHSTPAEYGDHTEEPVPFAVCELKAFVRQRGEAEVLSTSLQPFSFLLENSMDVPSTLRDAQLDCTEETNPVTDESHHFPCDTVNKFDEIAVARGDLGRFPGCELMSIIKLYARLNSSQE